MVDIEVLKRALREQGVDVDSEKFTMALRKAQNPAGCHWCGARTLVGVTNVKKKFTESACCARKIG